MPGITEHQLDRGANGMRNHSFAIGVNTARGAFVASVKPVVGALTVVAPGRHQPRSISLEIIVDGTVQTRAVTVLVTGRNQFGEPISESLVITGVTAGQTVAKESTKVFAWVDAASVTVATNIANADRITLGVINPATGDAVRDVIWGLPWKISAKTDILGGFGLEAGAAKSIALANDETGTNGVGFVTAENGVKFNQGVGLDSGEDRAIFLFIRTTW